MKKNQYFCYSVLIASALSGLPQADAGDTGNAISVELIPPLYQQHCASCHGADRLGGSGPALLPESLERLKKAEALKTVTEGRAATQMPSFAQTLSAAEREALVTWLYQPSAQKPAWTEQDIRQSRIVHAQNLPAKPVFSADPMNLFLVVETGSHQVSVLDGDKLERIHRFPTRYALHGGPKFSPDGRYVYFASRDGWISQYDLWNLTLVSEIRAGINTRNVAVSSDGEVIAVANYLPHSVVLLDKNLQLIKVIDAKNLRGDVSSRVAAIYDAGPRHSFVAALKDIPELWEISYDPQAEKIYDGYVHDYKMGEAIALPGYLNPRRTALETPLEDFFFDQPYRHVMGASRQGQAQVVNLDIRRKIADLALEGMPHLGSGITWERNGRTVMASPNLKNGVISVIDMGGPGSLASWQTIAQIPTAGPGFFLRSHENTPYAWTDAMMSPGHKHELQIIDKQSLQVVKTVSVKPGQTLAHIEFTRDGRYALASLWEREANGGAIIVYDATTLAEVKRIPMDKPVGKYNLSNKIGRSSGTSH